MSEEPGEIYSYIFAWHSLSDACEKCQVLNGKEYYEQDLFQNTLWDPFLGDVWDLNADIPLTHPNCRCQLEVRTEIDLDKNENYFEIHEWLGEFNVWGEYTV